jgi:hypothetical protein
VELEDRSRTMPLVASALKFRVDLARQRPKGPDEKAPASCAAAKRPRGWCEPEAAADTSGPNQTRKSPISVPPIPDLAGKLERGGNFRFPIGRERESGNSPFPDSAGKRESGLRLAANREIGDTPRCEYSRHDPGLDVALSPSNADSGLPHLPS